MDIKRYDIVCGDPQDFFDYEESETGGWIMFEDLQPLLTRLEFLEKQLSLCNLKVIKAREVLS